MIQKINFHDQVSLAERTLSALNNKIVKLAIPARNMLISQTSFKIIFKNCARIKSMRNYSIKNKRTKIGKNP